MSIFYCDMCGSHRDSDFIESKLMNGYTVCESHEVKNIIFTSCGNDSVALLQWALEAKLENIVACYSNTQWAAGWWAERVKRVAKWVEDNGGEFVEIQSEGFENLVKRKKAFPANGMGFCSYILKIEPALKWLEEADPLKLATCYTGVMRLESERRKNWPTYLDQSPNHGDRPLHSPLAEMSLIERDALLDRAGFRVLGHRSMECSPCINATISDLQQLPKDDVQKVHELEVAMGVGERSGKHKYMFRKHRMGGAEGIKQVVDRANHGGGDYSPMQGDLYGCDSGFCE